MSGAALPYHLRPHKAVDRRLFVDLLGRFERWRPVTKYVYASMGSYPLEDHKAIHRLLGISRLLAFDFEEEVVARQLFNKPVERCVCLNLKSGDFIAKLDNILERSEFAGYDGVVIWLDYTNPREIGFQIREFETLIGALAVGDIIRVTVNAHASNFDDQNQSSAEPMTKKDRATKQLERLKGWIGDYMPNGVTYEDMYQDRLPILLSACFGFAADKALPATTENSFLPLSLTKYADGLQMLSITGVIAAKNEMNEVLNRIAIFDWPFFSGEWSRVHKLVVPALTLRERLFLERAILDKNDENIIGLLGFSKASGIDMREFLDNFRRYYRFYPTLVAADI